MNLIEHYIGGKIVTGSSSRKGRLWTRSKQKVFGNRWYQWFGCYTE